MLRKLIVLALTSGLAAKAYRAYSDKRGHGPVSSTGGASKVPARPKVPPTRAV